MGAVKVCLANSNAADQFSLSRIDEGVAGRSTELKIKDLDSDSGRLADMENSP
jgi:hypothetical protein